MTQRIGDARFETAFLLLVANLQPELDEQDAVVDNIHLELGTDFEKLLMLCLRTKAHHVFDTGPIVPAAIENDDFTCRGEVSEVALHI